MKEVHALQSFDHDGPRKRGDRFAVSAKHAEQLERAGLVRLLDDGPTPKNPSTADGAKSSASPAAQASRQATAKPSKRGGRKKKAAE